MFGVGQRPIQKRLAASKILIHLIFGNQFLWDERVFISNPTQNVVFGTLPILNYTTIREMQYTILNVIQLPLSVAR